MDDQAGKMVDGIFNSLLESTGGMQDIKQAIETRDLAAIVRAATGALRKTLSIPMVLAELKSAEQSNQFRKEGNIHYLNKDYTEAILCYNKALAYAPNNSIEVKLAYSNISAVMLTITAFRDCISNVKAALALDCPEFLRVKLDKRMIEAETKLMIEMIRDMMISDKDMIDYAKFDVERNAEIPCASVDVSVDDGKKIIAAKEIKSGTMVAMERAFVSVYDSYEEYTSCYNCHKMCLFFIPCEGCCKALFCSKECREKCLEEYHQIECHIVAYMGSMYRRDVNRMAIRAAIKMSLKLGWAGLRVASLEMGEKLLKKSSVSEAFDCNNPVSLLCYDDQITVPSNDMVLPSIICASAVYCLGRVPGYFPEAFDYYSESYRCGVQLNTGWFSFTSKLAHSCEPNLIVLGFNDHVALVALQRIKQGDQLTISYTDHFYDMKLPPGPQTTRLRQMRIYRSIQYMCQCRVCLLGWHKGSPVPGTLTNRQKQAYNRCKAAMDSSADFKQQMAAIGAALDEFSDPDCANTTQRYNLYGDLRRTLNICQCTKYLNRGYDCVGRYFFVMDQ